MHFATDPADERFRREVQSFLKTNWVPVGANPYPGYPCRQAFALAADVLREKRWLAPGWPSEWGGANLSPTQRKILEEELVAASFPPKDAVAVDLAGPMIYTFGSLEQKRRYLPRILSGKEVWCQGFSEAESGSDVSSLTTSAVRDGAHYVVEGRKLWTSNAHFADMMFTLVRLKVAGRLERGLTVLLINMHDPNVVVRPIVTIDGGHHLNEVSINGARVPVSNVVGEPGHGWQSARALLARERILLAGAPSVRQGLSRLKRHAASARRNGRCLLDDASFMKKLAQIETDLLAVEFAVLRVLHGDPNDPVINGLACALKVRGAELRQQVSELGMEALGERGLKLHLPKAGENLEAVVASSLARMFLFYRSATIAGGTTEIQKNVIAGVTLGL